MEGQAVKWASTDSSIASVNELGVVHGEKVGNVTITASVGDKFSTLRLYVSPGDCTEAADTIEIGKTRQGYLNSSTACLLSEEPADGWLFNVAVPESLQIDVAITLYFAHVVLTDAKLKPLATGVRTAHGVTIRRELPPGSYIVWILADFEDGAYQLSIKPAQ
jgi:hypothetical protein